MQVAEVICQSITKHSLSLVTLYPNPSDGKVYLETDEDYKIIVYNSLGQIVHSCTVTPGKNLLDFNELTKGIYIIHLIRDKETNMLKLILQ